MRSSKLPPLLRGGDDYVQLVVDEFALKAMVEREDDDILISKVKSISSSSKLQNNKLIAAL